jgi:anti-sigma factor RsiW
MDCNETRDLLNSLVDDELPAVEAEAVKTHLQHCAECQHEYQLIFDLHKTISKVPRYSVPESLATQVSNQIASFDENHPTSLVWNRWLTLAGTHVAAALIGAGIFFSIWSLPDNPAPLQDYIISAHVSSLMKQKLTQITTGDTHTVKPWFAGKVDYAPPVYDLNTEGFPLIGGRVDQFDDRKVAVLVYQRRKHWISLFIDVSAANAQQFEQELWSHNGYNVVTMQQGDFIYSAVSDLSAVELEIFFQLILANN